MLYYNLDLIELLNSIFITKIDYVINQKYASNYSKYLLNLYRVSLFPYHALT